MIALWYKPVHHSLFALFNSNTFPSEIFKGHVNAVKKFHKTMMDKKAVINKGTSDIHFT